MQGRDQLLGAAGPDLTGKAVLLVEDSPEDREKYATILAAAGARVEKVETLDAARSALGSGRCDILVLDRLLPDGDAFEWLRAERHRNARIPPCVVLSGHLDAKTYRSIYDAGAVPLPKHYVVHSDVLVAAIGSAVRFAPTDAPGSPEPPLSNPLLPAEYRGPSRGR